MDFISELTWRGLIHQVTDKEALASHLSSEVRSAYIGFDPTSDSLTIGNLIQIILLRHFQLAGHKPIVVLGGGTGLIGDPSGKSAERLLMTRETVQHHVECQRKIFERILDFTPGPTGAIMVNNLDWLDQVKYLEMLRDIGKFFSVNAMIQRDSVRERLHSREQGISYTEFSYMILQAYDFLHLHRVHGVTLQLGGSDQWGNILSGIDLIRRLETAETQSFGLTTPLVTKSDGSKFGKSESGAIWLSPNRTSPYAFYQFWLNTSDQDVIRYLKLFSFFDESTILTLEQSHNEKPFERIAHKKLAESVTELVFGKEAVHSALEASKALFSGEISSLDKQTFLDVMHGAPQSQMPLSRIQGSGLSVVDVLVETGLAKSKRESREFLEGRAVQLNGNPVSIADTITPPSLLHGEFAAIRRGKKNWHLVQFVVDES